MESEFIIIISHYDTSVFGGYFDEEFSNDTIPFFQRIEVEHISIIISEMLRKELSKTPQHVIGLLDLIPDNLKRRVDITDEVQQLTESYISEKVVDAVSYADCIHIALATINKTDILISWNFKHIVNIDRIRGYNSVNLR